MRPFQQQKSPHIFESLISIVRRRRWRLKDEPSSRSFCVAICGPEFQREAELYISMMHLQMVSVLNSFVHQETYASEVTSATSQVQWLSILLFVHIVMSTNNTDVLPCQGSRRLAPNVDPLICRENTLTDILHPTGPAHEVAPHIG